MKTTKLFIIIAFMMNLSVTIIYAQNTTTEIYKGTITRKYDAGCDGYFADTDITYYESKSYTDSQLYDKLLVDAKKEYGKDILLRQFQATQKKEYYVTESGHNDCYHYIATGQVYQIVPVKPEPTPVPKPKPVDVLKQAVTKALQNITEGSRLAIDQIRVANGDDKDDFKDQVIEIVLDEGYKVVAKEYLERLYEEQKNQQTGIYNDKTIVQENNFSAVGYYINVKKTEEAIKVQIINVSTGEYEANVTVKLNE